MKNYSGKIMNFKQDAELEQFVRHFLEYHGALMEKEWGGFEVLLPETLSEMLGVPEHIQLSADPDCQTDTYPGVQYSISYGSPLLDKVVAVTCSQAPLLFCNLAFDYIKTQGFDRLISRQFAFSGSVGKVENWARTMTEYLFLSCRYLAQSDEQKEGIVSLIFNLETSAPVPEMVDMLTTVSKDYTIEKKRGARDDIEIKKIMQWVKRKVADAISREIAPFQQSMTRRFRRDVSNLREYYASLEKEMGKSLSRPGLSKQLQMDRKEKIAMLPEELKRKEDDLFKKYSIRVKAQPCAAILVRTPAVKVLYQASIGRKPRTFSLIYNPVTKSMDPLVCEGCGCSMTSAFFNNQLQLLCHDCSKAM